MIVARSLVNSLRIAVANDADSRAFEVFSAFRNERRVLQTAIEIVHQFYAILRRKLIAERH